MWLGRGFDTDGDGNNDFFVTTHIDRETRAFIANCLVVVVALWAIGLAIYYGVMYASGAYTLTAAKAKGLAALHLERLDLTETKIDAGIAKELAEFRGKYLFLNKLSTLDQDTARALATFKGEAIALQGLASLDVMTAKALAGFNGKFLSLNGLTTIDADTAKALASRRFGGLGLRGLQELSVQAVAVLRADPRIELPDKFRRQ